MVVYDRFRLAAKLSFRSRVTFEDYASSSRTTSPDHSRQPNQSSHHHQLLELWPRRHSVITLLSLLTRSLPGPRLTPEEKIFEIKMGLITMVQASPFCGKANEDVSAHLQQFLEICSTFVIKGVSQDAIRLCLFLFALQGRAKQWFYANKNAVDTWDKCANAFLGKFFSTGKTNALRGRILSFQQASNESIPEAWERLQEYILACPHHGMDNWLILQNFYNG